MSQRRIVVWLCVLAACSADEAIGAGVNTAINVAATGINRAATGACWGDCSYGTHCNHITGMCVPDEETDPAAQTPAAADPTVGAAAVPALRPQPATFAVCEVSGGACLDEGATCTLSHDECVGQCRCIGLTWQCLESCR